MRKLVGIDITDMNIEELLKGMDVKSGNKEKQQGNDGLSSSQFSSSSPSSVSSMAPSLSALGGGSSSSTDSQCQTAPYMRCGVHDEAWNVTYGPWKRLFNLHVHSKHTGQFRTAPCPCQDQMPYLMSGDNPGKRNFLYSF